MGRPYRLMVTGIVLALVLSSATAIAGTDGRDLRDGRDGSRASWTVKHFAEHQVPVDLEFLSSRENTTYHVPVPNSGTVTSATVTLEGRERYSLKGNPTGFGTHGHSHDAYWGESGQYPPVKSPTHYMANSFTPQETVWVASQDHSVISTVTPLTQNPPPLHWPYHMYDMTINRTDMVWLRLKWVGAGYNPENETCTHGARMYIWNHSGRTWFRWGSYQANDTAHDLRSFTKDLRQPYDFTDRWGSVNILVFGMHDEPNPGGGWPDQGQVVSDYVAVTVLKNDTLERPASVDLSIGDQAPLWSTAGPFTSTVTVGDSHGLKGAIQAYVDAVPPGAPPVMVPFKVSVSAQTWGMVRVKSLSIGVREVDNLPPRFLSIKEVELTEDVDLLKGLDLRDHFDDDYNGKDLLYEVAFEENASLVHAVMHEDGHSVNFITVADDWAGNITFRFNATDVWGLTTESDDFTIRVTEVNDRPRFLDPGTQYLEEDSPFLLNLTVIDPDVQYGDHLAFTDDTTLFDVDPATRSVGFTPVQGDVGVHNVTITARDARGASDECTVQFVITEVNDPPVIESPDTLVAHEGQFFQYTFTIHDEDGDTRFTWDLVGALGSMSLGVYTGRLTWTPEREYVGMVNVSVIAMDRQGSANQITVFIQVLNLNDPPELEPLDRVHLREGVRFVHTIAFTDPDLEVDPEERHTISVEPPLFALGDGGVVDFTPTNDDVGVHLVNVTVTDAGGLSHTLAWELVVENVNQAPTLERLEDQVWYEDEPAHLVLVAHDIDAGDCLTFSDSTSLFDVDPRTGVIDFTPSQHMVGEHDVHVKVRDEGGLYAEANFKVSIISTNDPPTASIRTASDEDHFKQGDTFSLAAEVSDPDNERSELLITWFLDGEESGNDDTITLKDLRPGDHTVELRVEDGDNSVSAYYAFSVEEVVEPYPWGTLVALLVMVVVVVVLVVKVVLPALRGERGPPGPAGQPEGTGGPEGVAEPLPEDEGPFGDWNPR